MIRNIELDAREQFAQITVTITHLREAAWRLRIASWLIWLAQVVAPLQFEVVKSVAEPCLLYCPYCGRDFASLFVPGEKSRTSLCPHCNRQSFVENDGETAWTVKEPAPCDYGCGFAEPYGFVPEAGCPVHDG